MANGRILKLYTWSLINNLGSHGDLKDISHVLHKSKTNIQFLWLLDNWNCHGNLKASFVEGQK